QKIDENLAYGLPSALALRNMYVDALSYRDATCPSLLAEDSIIGTWEGGCSSSSHDYYGTGIFVEIENSAPDIPYEMSLQTSFEIANTQGMKFISGGIATRFEMDREHEYLIEETIGGTYQHETQEGWASVGVTSSLRSERVVESNGSRGYLDGGVGYSELSLQFSMLQYDTSDCTSPFGSLSIRDPSGYWFQAMFEDCSGCATLWWHDSDMGDFCVGDILLREIDNLFSVERP
ncbi:MAG: hypothetical protein CL916_01695, partial [Deltaproteobacteria bacterium]|nr:hypothetical protein [Deltaproteobacteria bacterium]